MNKKILTISLVAVAAITASVTTAFAMRKDTQVFNHYAAAENEYSITFTKQHFSAGTFDHSYDVILPFSLSTQTTSGSPFSTIAYDSSEWTGTYAYVAAESDIDLDNPDEILSITRSNTGISYSIPIGIKICPDASFNIESSYASYTIDGVSKTEKFTYWYQDSEDGYYIYYVNPSIYGPKDTVFSLKFIYITYTC
jgi:hypothetical protein